MSAQASQKSQGIPVLRRFDRWSIVAGTIAILVVLPICAVLWIALTASDNIWPHLISTTLPRYLSNSVILAVSVGVLSASVGSLLAWMVTMYQFPGVRILRWALLLPLAIPAYVGAYALVDFLEYAGPVQTLLREVFGWTSARDYWFPEIRSRWAAVIVLSAALCPYVYLLVRSALLEQPAGSYEVARALGAGPVARLWKVGLPLARPAIVAGTAIVMMETVSDFGVVSYFAVQTLTTGIFGVWLEGGNRGGAAQIASVILIVVLVLVAAEKTSRNKRKFHRGARQTRTVKAADLGGWQGWLAAFGCSVPVVVGFVLPVMVIGGHALKNAERWADPELIRALGNSLLVGGVAAVVTVTAALCLVYGVRLSANPLARKIMPVTTIGYAAPGAVLGIGLLFPMAALDHFLADASVTVFGYDPGLMMTGSAFAIIYAYTVRFFAIGQGAMDTAFGRVAPSLPMAARSLGQPAGGVLRKIYMPLIRNSIGTALLLVFVDCIKELPATLLLRPFNFNTLSTRVYEKASLEQIGNAAPAAMLVICVGLVAVLLVARTSGETK